MKNAITALVALLTWVLPAASQAATLQNSVAMKNAHLESIRGMWQSISKKYSFDQGNGYHYAVDVVARSQDELIENTVKQVIYRGYTSHDAYAKPDDVKLEKIEGTVDDIMKAVQGALRNLPVNDGDENRGSRIAYFVASRIAGNRSFVLYRGSAGNSFGGGEFLAIVDLANKQILVLGSDYWE